MKYFMQMFSNFEFGAVQNCVDLVDPVKSFPTIVYLQKSASIEPRTKPPEFRISSPRRQKIILLSAPPKPFPLQERVRNWAFRSPGGDSLSDNVTTSDLREEAHAAPRAVAWAKGTFLIVYFSNSDFERIFSNFYFLSNFSNISNIIFWKLQNIRREIPGYLRI